MRARATFFVALWGEIGVREISLLRNYTLSRNGVFMFGSFHFICNLEGGCVWEIDVGSFHGS